MGLCTHMVSVAAAATITSAAEVTLSSRENSGTRPPVRSIHGVLKRRGLNGVTDELTVISEELFRRSFREGIKETSDEKLSGRAHFALPWCICVRSHCAGGRSGRIS